LTMNHTADGANSSGAQAALTDSGCLSLSKPNFDTGFPRGYFRIRAKGSDQYLQPHFHETKDGTVLSLYNKMDVTNDAFGRITECFTTRPCQMTIISKAFFINHQGHLCCKDGGATIDVMGSSPILTHLGFSLRYLVGNALILAHHRPPTLPWPNPWSHDLPQFTYCCYTETIAVKFHCDPSVDIFWPRPESEWKDKEFIVVSKPKARVSVLGFASIARWAQCTTLASRWTDRTQDWWSGNSPDGVAVEERGDYDPEDVERREWVFEGT